jgi:hypothetical protein
LVSAGENLVGNNSVDDWFWAGISGIATTALGTLFALVTGGNAVAQFYDESNVKFRANRLRNWLALAVRAAEERANDGSTA